MNEKEIVLTREGLEKLERELDDLKSIHRREVNDRIRQAKEFGDLSENAEYEDAKQEQAFIEGRILKLEQMIRNARLIDESDYAADEVHLGSTSRSKISRPAPVTNFRSSAPPRPTRSISESATNRRWGVR